MGHSAHLLTTEGSYLHAALILSAWIAPGMPDGNCIFPELSNFVSPPAKPGVFSGEIKAIVDWEMAHIGDPLEDLAWGLNCDRIWSWSQPEDLALMLPRERAIGLWEATSGLKAEPAALFWWEVFSSIKGMAIWISMNRVYATGGNTDAIICFGGLWAGDYQRRILIEQMREKK